MLLCFVVHSNSIVVKMISAHNQNQQKNCGMPQFFLDSIPHI